VKPKRVKIGWHWWDIEFRQINEFTTDGDGLYGLCNKLKKKIYVDTESHEDIQRQTLLHEILHAIWAVADIGDSEDEEETILKLSPLLMGVLIENPAVTKYIFGD
jgi:hypothetical protein